MRPDPGTAPDNEYYRCPVCGQKLARVGPGAAAAGVYVWCKHCKRERELRFPRKKPPQSGAPI